LRHRLAGRGWERDAGKLADFDVFVAGMRPGIEPAAPHAVVDNRLSSTAPLGAQVAALVQNLSSRPTGR